MFAALLVVAVALGSLSTDQVDRTTSSTLLAPPLTGPRRAAADRGFRVLWQRDLAGTGVTPAGLEPEDPRVGVLGATVGLITEEGRLHAFDAEDGTPRWNLTPTQDGTGRISPGLDPSGPGSTTTSTLASARIDGIRVSGGGYFVVQRWGKGYGVDPASGKVLWGYDGTYFMAGPTFPDAFSDKGGSIHRQGPTPAEQWLFPISGSTFGTSVSAGETVVVFGMTDDVVGVDRRSGEERWRVPAPAGQVADVEVTGESVMVLSPQGDVDALDILTGNRRWAYHGRRGGLGAGRAAEFAAVGADRILVHTFGQTLAAVRVADGSELWSVPFEDWGFVRGRVGERYAILGDSQGVVALDRSTGAIVAERTGSDTIGPPATDGDRVCLASYGPVADSPVRLGPPGSNPGTAPGTAPGTTPGTTRRPPPATSEPTIACLVPG